MLEEGSSSCPLSGPIRLDVLAEGSSFCPLSGPIRSDVLVEGSSSFPLSGPIRSDDFEFWAGHGSRIFKIWCFID